ncbi:outer membrane protein [Limnohabitans sp.]|uniref:outer membrane protein n=1 Tax=Limnohabitans sp. TaxID=1907725 RepID=UPI0039BD8330|nr:porin family protein [Comamonadaceae bacterium]
MKKVIIFALFLVVASGVMAQVANFKGFSGGLNLNTVSASTKITGDDTTFNGIGQQSWNGSLQAAYGFVTSPSTVISIGGTYGLGNIKAGEIVTPDRAFAIKVKNQLSLYVEPGFLLSNSTLAYGKISYNKAKAVSTFTGGPDESQSMKGTGFGFGVRTMLDKRTFFQVEVNQVGYKQFTYADGGSFKPKATVGTMGFGVKF